MSEENVDLVRRSIEAYVAGDVDAYVEFFAEDVEVFPDVSLPEAKPFRGREQFRRFVAEVAEGWEGSATGDIQEIFSAGERVIARADWGGKGRTSGIDLRSNLTSVCTFRDGKITRIEYFFNHAEALEAAGLRE
jgi:ketosteroid isomerase-like protein